MDLFWFQVAISFLILIIFELLRVALLWLRYRTIQLTQHWIALEVGACCVGSMEHQAPTLAKHQGRDRAVAHR